MPKAKAKTTRKPRAKSRAPNPEAQFSRLALHDLKAPRGSHRARIRKGRGPGSGIGKTAGRGGKGQTARTGVHIKGFEGGQMPLHMRLPKRGFNNIFRRDFVIVNLGRLQAAIDSGRLDAAQPINGEVLRRAGLLRQVRDGVRLLGTGELKAKITVEVAGASKSAIAAVEKAGGQVVLPKPAAEAAEPAAKG